MKITEKNFIEQLNRKNEKALDYVLLEYGWIIQTVTRKHLHNLPELQKECVNDVLLAVWEHIESYDSKRSTFKNWLAGVSRFKALDSMRRHLRYSCEESLETTEAFTGVQTDAPFLERELSEETTALLSCLNPSDQTLFIRLFFQEETVQTVAADMGIRTSALYNRISRGRRKIQREYLQNRKERIE
ncbi:sigma-70 family RNA polymerase sigma factor [Anoxybacterium hadale]|uniref:Sigma-70 family RNA polymerase sigma factor n=1 Tax=Anoxybacterium hadale TaxID=3408580 RepID=A0ACD1AB48_9FIRM|nr:sigma-70 family RNA polymerase sigma factor [Clostridiales bacterium]